MLEARSEIEVLRHAAWLPDGIVVSIASVNGSRHQFVDRLTAQFAKQRVGCLEGEALDRLVATAQCRFEDQVLAAVDAALSPERAGWIRRWPPRILCPASAA
ncbi:hypothetical protein [Mesorhizobium sp. ISC15]|uniref:hypothetical protein n=1 Tax=Mesorhizobium sp. ISC15 TaxID=3076429 RepID=UPI00301E24C8